MPVYNNWIMDAYNPDDKVIFNNTIVLRTDVS